MFQFTVYYMFLVFCTNLVLFTVKFALVAKPSGLALFVGVVLVFCFVLGWLV